MGTVRSPRVSTQRVREGCTNPKDLLEFCRLGKLDEVLGPVALGDNWMCVLAGLRRWLRARARAGHRE